MKNLIGKTVLASLIAPLTLAFADSSVHKVRVNDSIAEETEFEPSGVIYIPNEKRYLVVSDDTDGDKSPLLFYMTDTGEVTSRIRIPGLDIMTDMESISIDGKNVYVMSSLVPSKSGKYKEEQNLLVRMQLNGNRLSNSDVINFGDALRSALESSNDSTIKNLISDGSEELEIEGHVVKNGVLFVGIKGPVLSGGESVVLKIDNLNGVMENREKPNLKVFAVLDFEKQGKQDQKISDITFVGNDLYLTTASAGKRAGGVWKLAAGSKEPQLLQYYAHAQPEGIALNTATNTFMILFDMGKETGLYAKIKLQ